MKRVVLSLLCLFSFAATVAHANPTIGQSPKPSFEASFEGFVQISANRELYVEYTKANEGKPTVILLNGLTYSTRQWASMIYELKERGLGILAYDMYGHGRTLLRYAPVVQKVPYEEQVEDLRKLLKTIKLPAPYNLVGLSYGGGIGMAFTEAYPNDVKNLILVAPFTQALDGQDAWIKGQIWATRNIFPFNRYTDDELYDHFLQQIVYATYPQWEPIVLENPFKLEATFRLVQGIRQYRPIDTVANIPKGRLHLMVAVQDQYIQQSVLDNFWDKVPERLKASRIYVYGSEHKMPEAVPAFTTKWVEKIVLGEKELFKGYDFEGYPFRQEIRRKN